MNACLSCKVTLSNKLKKLIAENSTASLSMGIFENGHSVGHLKIELEDYECFEELKSLKNTCIMIEGIECFEDIPKLEYGDPVQSFGLISENSKLAITDPKEKLNKIKNLDVVKAQAKKYAPTVEEKNTVAKVVMENEYKKMMKQCLEVPGVDKEVTISKDKKLSRQEAVKFEKELEKIPKLKTPFYIKNKNVGKLEISDLFIGSDSLILQPNEVFDLSRIPAKILLESKGLKSLFLSNKHISLATKEDFENWAEKKTFDSELEILDDRYKENSIYSEKISSHDDDIDLEKDLEILDDHPEEELSVYNELKIQKGARERSVSQGKRMMERKAKGDVVRTIRRV